MAATVITGLPMVMAMSHTALLLTILMDMITIMGLAVIGVAITTR